jgi:opacity protein-like surface antigen
MRKLLVIAGLAMAGSAGAEGIEFWALGGETFMTNGGLGSASCVSGEICIGGSGNDIKLTDGFHFGFRGGFNSGDHLGYETGYMYNRTSLDVLGVKQGMAYHQVMFNGLYYITGPDSKFRPFGTAGVGFTNYAQPGTSAAYGGGTTKLGFNYGGGVKIKLTPMFGLRFDVRQATTPKPFGLPLASGWLRENEISAGFGILF